MALAIGCGGGGSGSGATNAPPTLSPLPDGQPVVLGLLQLSGQPSFLGRTTTKTAVLRHDGTTVEVLDFAAGGRSAVFERSVLSISPPETAWTIATFGGTRPALLRSDDLGASWQVAAELPFDFQSVLGLHVESADAAAPTAWVAVSEDSFPGVSGPFVWTKRLQDDSAWQLAAGIPIPPWPYSADARFARSTESAEVLVRGDEISSFHRLGTDPLESQPFTPGVPFLVAGWTAMSDRRWVAGELNDTSDFTPSAEAAVLSSDDGVSWQVAILPGLTRDSHVSDFDFLDDMFGFVCGWDAHSYDTADPFCFATGDGGASWQRGTIDVPSGTTNAGAAGVVRTSPERGVATSWIGRTASVLTTADGGATWQRQSLPPLATRLDFGVLARASSALVAAATAAPASKPTATPASAASIARPLQASGPVAWAVGDTADRGAAIDGIVLRSDDGGATWQELLAAPGGSFADVDFVDRETGWIVGAGRILRSDDGGATFADQTGNAIGLDGPLLTYALAAGDAAHAVAAVVSATFAYELLFTDDGGARWQPAMIEPPPQFASDHQVDDVCLTAGGAGLLRFTRSTELFATRDGGASWRPVDPRAGRGAFNDNGFLGAPLGCTGSASLSAIIGGFDDSTATVWSSQDGGATWSDATDLLRGTGGATALLGSFVRGGSSWLAYGDQYGDQNGVAIFGTRDGGVSWTNLDAPFLRSDRERLGELPEALAIADDARGMLLTSRLVMAKGAYEHAVLASADGGASWTRHALPSGFHPLRVDYVP